MKIRTNKINLLPKEYVYAEQIRRVFMIIGCVLALEVTIFVRFVVIPPKAEIKDTINKLDEVSLKLNDDRFGYVNQTIQQLEDTKMAMKEWIEKYSDLKQENFISKRVLDSLLSRVPIDLTLDKLLILPENQEASQLERTISIEGRSQNMISILNYTTVIESTYGAGTTSYEAGYDEGQGVYKYKINVSIPVEKSGFNEN